MNAGYPTLEQLKRAIQIEEQIEALQAERAAIFGGASVSKSVVKKNGRSGKRSAATRAKMRAAQQARWAKKNGTTSLAEAVAKPTKAKKKRTLSPESRARIAEAQKKRWAAAKAGK